MKSLLLLVLSLGWLSCAGTSVPSNQARDADVITVEGQVTVRGHTPFTAVMIETDQRNLYVLALDEAQRRTLEPDLPARFRVTGILYAGDWNGMPYAHLNPTSMERL